MDGRSNRPLTEKQQDILAFIQQFALDSGMPPTVGEIAKEFGIATPTAFTHLQALQRKGQIRRSTKARSIALVNPVSQNGEVRVPVLGSIRAGLPLLAEENHEELITLNQELLRTPQSARLFGLRIVGDSMEDAGIREGDTIIARAAETAADGEIVVALVHDEEATVKRLYRTAGGIELRPANEAYEVQHYKAEELRIQGVVVFLYRNIGSALG
ncbi:MAG TPA: repressor LexA [Lentisphaeria bacterium]|jgi:repressor LexA|nr:repressor LexA [Lentisphaeria bacterium]